MNEVDLQAGLRSLHQSLRQIEALLEWERLKQSETRPHQPPSFQLYDPIETDLRNEYAFFLSTCVQMQAILNDPALSLAKTERESAARQLARIEQRANGLQLPWRSWRNG